MMLEISVEGRRPLVRAGLLLWALVTAGNVAAEQAPDQAAPGSENAAVNAMLAPWTGDLEGMIERRYVRILVVPSRTHYFIDRGQQLGLSVEGAREFETMINRQLDSKAIQLTVALVPVSRDELFPALIEGRGDIIAANLTITPERAAIVDFSQPFAKGVREVLVTRANEAEVTSPEALSGRTIWVRPTSSYHASLLRLNETLAASGKPPVAIRAADERLEEEDLLEMVSAGIIPATVVDNHLAQFWVSVLEDLRIHDNAAVRTDGQLGWAVRKDSPGLKAAVDEFAQANAKGTLLMNIMAKRYLENNKWVKNPAAGSDLVRFQTLAGLFRTYGDKYDLPWVLVAAQAFQESGIDQSKTNPSGAVGVMQIKPSTAAGKPILIEGVDASAERNIEAGAKYLRWVVDQYYADEPMTQIDKALFAVASYNAGPARIARLRKQTTEMGLDPNRWFGNVEVAVAQDIGRETVQYVSNIYKYYVAYTVMLEETAEREAAKEAHAEDA